MAHLLKAERSALWASRTPFYSARILDEGVCHVNPIVRKTISPDKAFTEAVAPKCARIDASPALN